ncbi:hypothetical protein K5D56_26170 [Pseudomonas cichorii]|nr:hypothetical protein [Pseudomonas cichorii]MBX8557021.1 hypothetical protein [Pseudomonas cichorii]MBX8592864.1 hypothetical protein [Pseudomonas cichorii]
MTANETATLKSLQDKIQLNQFTFDVKLFASFTIGAESIKDAREKLTVLLDGAQITVGDAFDSQLTAIATVDGDIELMD